MTTEFGEFWRILGGFTIFGEFTIISEGEDLSNHDLKSQKS